MMLYDIWWRHLAVLVTSGQIIRRDSPNGKRFARKGQGGEIEQAYGFDLSPMLARAAEFKEKADSVKADRKALRLVKERLTLCRRDIIKLMETGVEEGGLAPGEASEAAMTGLSASSRAEPR